MCRCGNISHKRSSSAIHFRTVLGIFTEVLASVTMCFFSRVRVTGYIRFNKKKSNEKKNQNKIRKTAASYGKIQSEFIRVVRRWPDLCRMLKSSSHLQPLSHSLALDKIYFPRQNDRMGGSGVSWGCVSATSRWLFRLTELTETRESQ